MIKARIALPLLSVIALAGIAGCGGGSSSPELADLVPPGSLIYVEGDVQPSGAVKTNVDSLAQRIAGVDDLGGLIVEELESSADGSGEKLDFDKEVAPWLGERAAISFARIDGDGDPAGYDILLPATDTEAAQATIDRQAKISDDPVKKGSYEGVDYWVDSGDDTAVGLIGDTFVGAEDVKAFEAAVDASEGDSLAGEARFADAISAASDGSLADVYVDVGGIIDASGDQIDPQAREALKSAGIDPSDATAVASLIPGEDTVEFALSSDLGEAEVPSDDVSGLLGSLPADSFAAVASTGFSESLQEAIDDLDKEGIPGELPPGQLKSTLKAMGIDLDKIAGSLEDAAVFAQGSDEPSLGGALVLTSSSKEAAKTVANLGVLLRNTETPGVTAVSSNGVSGFSVRSPDLGRKPLVAVAKGSRVAVAYGLPPALEGLSPAGGKTLADTPRYEEAVAALGATPISGFVDGPGALALAEALVPGDEEDFQQARPYLKKLTFVGIGFGNDDDLATAKLIVGVK